MEALKVICVIVTYNRLELLKESVAAVMQQTYPLHRVVIVDNHSTDGTDNYLAGLSQNPLFHIVTLEKNTGGAGGFSKGIETAARQQADWIWVMDDDTIPKPDSLERLMAYTTFKDVGYVNSKVVWTDGSLHEMNLPRLAKQQAAKAEILKGAVEEVVAHASLIDTTSFVSLLVRGDIPYRLGLPFKEFFIWCDDAEYTMRITQNGYYGIWAADSVVVHKTPTNYSTSLNTVPASAAWKVYYGVRNESLLRRKRKGWLLFVLAQLNCFRTHAHRIRKRHLPKEEERVLLKANFRGLIDGFTFNPRVDFLK